MAKKKSDQYATDDELLWFDLSKYASLKSVKDQSGKTVVPYDLWATVIRDRIEILRFLDAGLTDKVFPLFESIKTAPLQPLGFKQGYSGPTFSSDTPTIKSITTNRVNWLHDAMIRTGATGRTMVDNQLITDTESAFGDYAHVMVNLQATDEQICANFKSWLKEWRKNTDKVTAGNYEQKIQTWAQALIVPYMDLELFTRMTGKFIQNERKFEMLLPHRTADEREAQRSRLQKMKGLVFTDSMALIVEHLAENEPSQFREKTEGELSPSNEKQ
ncbi:MAG: DUF6387 family protein [Pseudomonadota bacterium]